MSDVLKAIVDQLEEDIVVGQRHPRERLVEDDLVAGFGAKKHVIRQALVELERMGLVERIRNKGAQVRDYSPDDVRQIYAVRKLLEAEAAAQIPMPADPDLIAALEKVYAENSEAVASGDLRQSFRSNIRFHQVFFSACGNPYLVEAIENFALKSHAIRSYSLTNPDLLNRSRDDHRQIIDARRAGDREALIETCIQHLKPSERAYIAAYEKFFGSSMRRAG